MGELDESEVGAPPQSALESEAAVEEDFLQPAARAVLAWLRVRLPELVLEEEGAPLGCENAGLQQRPCLGGNLARDGRQLEKVPRKDELDAAKRPYVADNGLQAGCKHTF